MSKYTRTTSKGTVAFNKESSMILYMALECIDLGFSYSFYCDYMEQYPMILRLTEVDYAKLSSFL